MTSLKPDRPVATVIGDVVGSRGAGDRGALHARLTALVALANDTLAPAVPFRITVGDEFQGCFATVGEALSATLMLRLAGLPEVDLRHGIGWGDIAVLEEAPRVEDGPGWWAAREAIDEVKADAGRAGLRQARTAYHLASGTEGPAAEAVNAALLLRDHVVGGLSERSVGVVRGLLAGSTQREIAEGEGISASAVSQRVRNDGLAALLAAEELLRTVQ